jgi:hypothetical protein
MSKKLEENKIRRDLARINRIDTRHKKYVRKAEKQIAEYDLTAKQSKNKIVTKTMKNLSSNYRRALDDYEKTISSLNIKQDVPSYRKQLKDIRTK